ncbi:MAG: antitoxin [Clostridium sp.]|nr:antitoxin [Clostridium sp.]
MNVFLQIACRTIKRRMEAGEVFEDIMQDYPRMTAAQVTEIREELGIDA